MEKKWNLKRHMEACPQFKMAVYVSIVLCIIGILAGGIWYLLSHSSNQPIGDKLDKILLTQNRSWDEQFEIRFGFSFLIIFLKDLISTESAKINL